jgi:hypothetical protein
MHRLILLWPVHKPTGSTGAHSAYWEGIFRGMTFIVSPRMGLYMFLYSRLLMLGLVTWVSNECTKECRVVVASHRTISTQHE